MAYYKYIHFLEHEDGPEYDSAHEAGAAAPFSGIYHCEACGSSVTAAYALPLPAHDHHQHSRNKAKFDGAWLLNRIIGKIWNDPPTIISSGLAMTDCRAKTGSAMPKFARASLSFERSFGVSLMTIR